MGGNCDILFNHRRLARELGAGWTGSSGDPPPTPFQAAIIFAPVGSLMLTALRHTDRGGTVVSAGIRMSDFPSFPFADLYPERSLASVANSTRRDVREFLDLAGRLPLRIVVEEHPFREVNQVLRRLKTGQVQGAAVLKIAADSYP